MMSQCTAMFDHPSAAVISIRRIPCVVCLSITRNDIGVEVEDCIGIAAYTGIGKSTNPKFR